MSNSQPLVSIVVPVYNAERFIHDTVETVLNQTYTNWELLLVDDCSTDSSVELIKPYLAKEKRIKLLKNEINSGAAISRNKGIDVAIGRYIAFLDADDLWVTSKLEKQVDFMKRMDCSFSFTGYEFANAAGEPNGKKVHVPATITYKQALRNTTISTITVMFDMSVITKQDILMPDIKSEDTATWWKVLKIIKHAYGIDEVLSLYRRHGQTQSSNKIQSAIWTWKLYRTHEKLGLYVSVISFAMYTVNASRRRLG